MLSGGGVVDVVGCRFCDVRVCRGGRMDVVGRASSKAAIVASWMSSSSEEEVSGIVVILCGSESEDEVSAMVVIIGGCSSCGDTIS